MRTVKSATLQLAFHTGFFRLVQLAQRRQAVILLFHRFVGKGEGDIRGLPMERLAEYMEYLTRHYRVVSLRELAEELRQGVVGEYTAAVTVDDGYHETFSLAVPVFRRYGVPASFFVVSDFTDGRLWLWTDRFRFVFDRAPRGPVAFSHRGALHVLQVRDERERRRAEERWRQYAKRMSVAEREELLGAIAGAWGIEIPAAPPREYQPMTWAQLRALAAEGFDVGAHTRTHPILSRVDPKQLRDEIEGCKEQIERNVGFPVLHFAYPNGRKEDYTREAVQVVSTAGYLAAVTTVAGRITPSTSHFELRRIDASAEDLPRFAKYVSGFESAKA